MTTTPSQVNFGMWPRISPGWFRLFLAFVVVFYHASKVVFFGFWAVFVFFILSGFWITEMYRGRYSKTRHPWFVFYVSRLLRLYPVFIACTALGLAVIALGVRTNTGYKPEYMTSLIRTWILPGYSALKPSLLVPAWSLDIEFQFYLLFPLIYFCLSTTGIMRYLAGLLLVALMCTITAVLGIGNSITAYLLFFITGVAISHCNWEASPRLRRISGAMIVGLFCFLGLLTETRTSILSKGQVEIGGHEITLAVDAILALLTIPFVSSNVRIRDSKIGRHAGNLSFEVYLVHWIVLGVYVAHWGHLPQIARLPYFLVYLVATTLISLAVYILVDIPCERFRRRIVDRLSVTNI